jgi:hypothetical protein
MISQNFEINKKELKKDFMLLEYDEKRNWFFKTLTQQEQAHIRSKWYNYMTEVKANIYFFLWFERTYKNIKTQFIEPQKIGSKNKIMKLCMKNTLLMN